MTQSPEHPQCRERPRRATARGPCQCPPSSPPPSTQTPHTPGGHPCPASWLTHLNFRSKDSTASLLQQYSGQCSGQLGSNRGRYYQDKDKEIESSASRPVNSPQVCPTAPLLIKITASKDQRIKLFTFQNYLALKNSHLPIWVKTFIKFYSKTPGKVSKEFFVEGFLHCSLSVSI